MKKILSLLLCICIFKTFSQSAFEEKSNCVTVGYGFPNLYKSILRNSIENQQNAYSIYGANSGETYSYKTTGVGPIFLKYEYGITDHIAVGAVLGYFSAGLEERYTYSDQYYNSQTGTYSTNIYTDISALELKSLSLGARFNYHFSKKEKLDPYLGFAAGYTNTRVSVTYTSINPNSLNKVRFSSTNPIPIYLGLTFGLRYYFTNNVGIYTEFGLDKWAVIQGGVAFKFK